MVSRIPTAARHPRAGDGNLCPSGGCRARSVLGEGISMRPEPRPPPPASHTLPRGLRCQAACNFLQSSSGSGRRPLRQLIEPKELIFSDLQIRPRSLGACPTIDYEERNVVTGKLVEMRIE